MGNKIRNFVIKFLSWLSDLACNKPKLLIFPQIVLMIVAIAYSVEFLKFNNNRNELVGKNKKYHHNYLAYKAEFPNQDDIVVAVESENPEKNRLFVEKLGKALEAYSDIFTNIFYKGDLTLMGKKALMMLDEKTLTDLHNILKEYKPFINQFTSATNLESLLNQINRQFRTANANTNANDLVKALPAIERLISLALDAINRPGVPVSPGVSTFFGENNNNSESSEYITFDHGRLFLVTAQAKTEDLNAIAVQRARELTEQVKKEVPGVNVGITGETVLELDEMTQSQIDTLKASIVSIILVALIFIYQFNELWRPIKAVFALFIGLCYTLGFATLTFGQLNLLTITFLPMLIGLGIDFGIHLISRFEEELSKGTTPQNAIKIAMVNTGMGIFTGCLTTAAAFLAMGFTNFKGIQEMGVISGCGLILCLIPMITVLPALLITSKNITNNTTCFYRNNEHSLEKIWINHPYATLGIAACFTFIAFSQMLYLRFDYNLLKMQSKGLPAVQTEYKLINAGSNSIIFGVVLTDSLDQAKKLQKQLEALDSVASVKSMAIFYEGDQYQKAKIINDIRSLLRDINISSSIDSDVNLSELDRTLWSLQGYLGLSIEETAKEGLNDIKSQLESLRNAVIKLRQAILLGDKDLISKKLAAYQKALILDIKHTFEALKNQDSSFPVQPEDIPPAIRNRFVGRTGKLLLQVYPKHDVWQRTNQAIFVSDIRSVDPNATGTPVQLYEYTNLLKNSYIEAAWYSLAIIVIVSLIHFRSLISVILALLPVSVGMIWLGFFMVILDIPFNLANIMVLPLSIGIGVTSGIHILNRFAEEKNPSILSKSTGKAVIASGLTTVAGFGSLMLGKHQGIFSLGFVTAVGTMTCMIAALTVLPAVLKILLHKGWHIKEVNFLTLNK